MGAPDVVVLDADANVRQVVKKLMRVLDVDSGDVADALRIGRQSIYDRLSGKSRFTVQELAELACFMELDPGVFFWSPEQLRARLDEVIRSTASVHASASGSHKLASSGSAETGGVTTDRAAA